MNKTFHGIDFSGNVKKWTPGCGSKSLYTANVWVATGHGNREGPLTLTKLRRVQDLSGSGDPFDRLAGCLRRGEFRAAAIDAPFSIPARHVPKKGIDGLLSEFLNEREWPRKGRPFPKGCALVCYAKRNDSLEQTKPLRKTEQYWQDAPRRLNVRSTLWNGPRGGAPFTVANLVLLGCAEGSSERSLWPWTERSEGLLVEAFPAAQLWEWELPHDKYDGKDKDPTSRRKEIVNGLKQRIEIPDDDLRAHLHKSADALDAVLCLFAAKAAAEGTATPCPPDSAAVKKEGWIAVHP